MINIIDPDIPWTEDYRHSILPDGCLRRLQMTLDHWRTTHGFAVVSLPWMAPDPFMEATRPDFVDPDLPYVGTDEGALVCSGEQSFIWLHAQGHLPSAPGYIGWSPCFRREIYAPGRHHYFLKAELFVLADTISSGPSRAMMQQRCLATRNQLALNTMTWWEQLAKAEGVSATRLQIDSEDEHGVIDISARTKNLGQLELGSYGVRTCPGSDQRYIFGTALAEPRWAMAYSEN